MANSLSNWVKKNLISRYMMTDCPEKKKCLKILHLVLDDEATPEEEEYFTSHIDSCWSCFKDYKLEKAIKDLIKTKIKKKEVPEDLVQGIRVKLNESA